MATNSSVVATIRRVSEQPRGLCGRHAPISEKSGQTDLKSTPKAMPEPRLRQLVANRSSGRLGTRDVGIDRERRPFDGGSLEVLRDPDAPTCADRRAGVIA